MSTYHAGCVLNSAANIFIRRDVLKCRDTQGGREAKETGMGVCVCMCVLYVYVNLQSVCSK